MKRFKLQIKLVFFAPLFILTWLLFAFSCKKSSQVDSIPSVPVNLTVPLSLPQYSALNAIGNHVNINGGYKGIIIYRRTLDQFVAFERACPYDPTTSGAIVEADSSGILVVDRHCGSKFNLFDGSVVNGPATRGLKPYNVDYDSGTQTLYIYN